MNGMRGWSVGVARSVAKSCGIDFQRVSQYTAPMIRLAMLLERLETTVVIDIGANEGQYAADLRIAGYHGQIVSVEPLSAAHAALIRQCTCSGKICVR